MTDWNELFDLETSASDRIATPIRILAIGDIEEAVGALANREWAAIDAVSTPGGAADEIDSTAYDSILTTYMSLEDVIEVAGSIPVVVLLTAEEDPVDALEAGADEVVGCRQDEVPVTLLEKRIKRLVQSARELSALTSLGEAIEQAGHVVLITDEEGAIEYVNPAFESVTGYERKEVIGETPAILQSGEHDAVFYQSLWETITAGETWEGEIVNERKDGTTYVIKQTIAPVGEGPDRYVAINRDITQEKQRELELRFIKEAFDGIGVGVGIYQEDGRLEYINDHFADLLGTSPGSVMGRHIADCVHDYTQSDFESEWATFEPGETRVQEATIQRIDSEETFPAEVVGTRIEIEDTAYQISVIRDITDRKHQERDLKRFRSAVEYAGHGVIITDEDGVIEYVNPAFERLSGYSAAEAIGKTPAILKSGKHDEELYRDLWETIEQGDIWQGEIINEQKDGTEYHVNQTIAPIKDEAAGDPVGYVGINQDITELKDYERELEGQNERLQEYGQMVAHDLRNPLTLLDGQLDNLRAVIERDADPEEIESVVTDVEETSERMRDLVTELLSMAEQGKLVLEDEPVELESVADDAWQQIKAPDASLEIEAGAVINADPDRLREMLSNLFRNAIEHGGESVTIRVGPLDFGPGFYVEDDGPGIPPEDRDNVLDRGYTTAEEGTGFGLAIVTQIAEAHNWDVTVTEGTEGGARFEFEAPE